MPGKVPVSPVTSLLGSPPIFAECLISSPVMSAKFAVRWSVCLGCGREHVLAVLTLAACPQFRALSVLIRGRSAARCQRLECQAKSCRARCCRVAANYRVGARSSYIRRGCDGGLYLIHWVTDRGVPHSCQYLGDFVFRTVCDLKIRLSGSL